MIFMVFFSFDKLWFYKREYLGGREKEKIERERDERFRRVIIIEYSDVFVFYKEVKI